MTEHLSQETLGAVSPLATAEDYGRVVSRALVKIPEDMLTPAMASMADAYGHRIVDEVSRAIRAAWSNDRAAILGVLDFQGQKAAAEILRRHFPDHQPMRPEHNDPWPSAMGGGEPALTASS